MTSTYKGSTETAESVAAQIAERFGAEAVQEYKPTENCFTFKGWQERGYTVRKGEKSLHSFTFVEKREKDGSSKKYRKTVCLFYHLQVDKA